MLVLAPTLAWADSSPQVTVQRFYDGYLRNQKSGGRFDKLLAAQKARFDASLWKMLSDIADNQPGKDDAWLDFDPFINAQVYATRIRLGTAKVTGATATVPVYVTYERTQGESLAVRVSLSNQSGTWRMTNFTYPASADTKTWDLRTWLKEQLAR